MPLAWGEFLCVGSFGSRLGFVLGLVWVSFFLESVSLDGRAGW